MELREKLRKYVEEFNANDEELGFGDIDNAHAYDFLAENIPLIELPDDPVIERTYYFRWWTLRKHIRKTPEGHIFTEFLPDVSWAMDYNTISCAAGFHIREGRWLRDTRYVKDYITFWLHHPEIALRYASWFPTATVEYAELTGDWDFALTCLPGLEELHRLRRERAERENGLRWSSDNRDGMEFSIGGSGFRPTHNSYQCADGYALARLCELAGDKEKAAAYRAEAEALHKRLYDKLWRGDFFRTLPENGDEKADMPREQVGYIPWYFGLADKKCDGAFRHLLDEEGFSAPYGLTTVERRNPRFMEEHEHECLWNGPVWPFATTQTLTALANALHRGCDTMTNADYARLLRQYAAGHKRTTADGRVLDWIDEDMDPFTGEWIARNKLEMWGWRADKGGYERGKDYNHSMFCDLVLSGLLGIAPKADGGVAVEPLLPAEWSGFRVENLRVGGKVYDVRYDRAAGASVVRKA